MGSGFPSYWSPPAKDPVPDRDETKPTPTEDRLRRDYANLRLDCADLEELLGSTNTDLTGKDLKRLDKAVTVMKVAFKLIAKVLRRHGFDTSRAASVDTLPKGQDAQQGLAGTEGSAVAESETPSPNQTSIEGDN